MVNTGISDRTTKYALLYVLFIAAVLTPLNVFLIDNFDKLTESEAIKPRIKEPLQLDSGSAAKVHREVLEKITEKPKAKVRVLVLTENDFDSNVRKSSSKSRHRTRTIISTAADAGQITSLSAQPSTVAIYPDNKYTLLSDDASAVSAPALNSGLKGSGVRIAVLDSGINSGSYNIAGHAVFTGETSTTDALNHGTQIASIISSIAPEISILNVKVLNDKGEGYTSWIIQGIRWSIENKADAIVMSFGSPMGEIDVPLNDAIKAATDRGIAVVIAAGNCGNGCPAPSCNGYIGVTSPGNSPYAITVGAVNQNNEISCFSSHGIVNGVNKPEIVAPLVPGYSGTSMAAAYAAGVVSVASQQYLDYSPMQIKEFLAENAVDLGNNGYDDVYGAGLIRMESLTALPEITQPVAPQQDENQPQEQLPINQDNAINDNNNPNNNQNNNSNEENKYISLNAPYFSTNPDDLINYELKYDANGNLISAFGKFYEYDSLNQLTKVRSGTADGFLLEEYFYDDQGNRVKKIEHNLGGSEKITYYVSRDFVQTRDNTGTHNTVYFYQNSLLVGRKDSDGSKFYYHPNHLGSTDIITDQNGNVAERTEYLPFGAVLEGGNDRFLFTGKEKDKTGLMYYGARYYDPFLRHFTQPDTIIPDVYDPQQLNRYAYARNNPVKYTDETGHCPMCLLYAAGTFLLADVVIPALTVTPQVTYAMAHENIKEYGAAKGIGVTGLELTGGGVAGKAIGKGVTYAGNFVRNSVDDIFNTAKNMAGSKIGSLSGGATKASKAGEIALENFKKNPNFLSKSKTLLDEGQVNVNSFDEANALLRHNFPDAQKFSGVGPQSTKGILESFRDYRGTAFHTDYLRDPANNLIYRHEPGNLHAQLPHINIKSNGKEYTIMIDNMAR